MDPSPRRWWTPEIGQFLTLGVQLALAVMICGLAGYALDAHLGTAPWMMIAGLAVGMAGGLIKFIRTAMALGRKADDDAEDLRRPER